jgi:predicted Rossmann-fold nucleotide-binding protein
MQKLVNVLALLSFVGTASIVGAGAYVYIQKDALIERAKEAATEAATEAVVGALPGLMEGMMPEVPELPGATGGVVPEVPSATGGVMPF